MNCPKCKTPNQEGAQFCENCGTSLRYVKEAKPEGNRGVSDVFIFIYLGYLFFSQLIRVIIQKTDEFWYQGTGRYIFFVLNIAGAFMPLLLGIAIKNKALKIIGIIIAALWGMYIIGSSIEQIVQ